MMKKLIAMLMALVLCFGLVACGGSDDSADANGAIKVGISGPLTGDAAIYGTAVKYGMEIAIEEVNAKGGLQLELLFEDDVADGETALNAYNKMIDDGMLVSAGTVTSGAGQAVAPQSYKDQMFALTPSASSPAVTEGNDNVFQVCFSDPDQGVGPATYIKSTVNAEKVAVIYRNDDAYSQGIRDSFIAQAAVEGLNIVYEGTFTKDTATDFSVQVTAAKAAGADTLFLPIYYQPAALILAEADKQGYEPTIVGVDGMDGILTLENFDTSLAEGVILLTPFSADAEDEMTKNF
ncbi:MAG: ABC transporter substrate-binding protein, partial [Oscillospiraceae bacterium]|nr:ABC transporter substrate-binding protein [Oscillospiraceae bacterium]